MKVRWLTLALCLVSVAAIPAFAGAFTIGLPADTGTGNCFPFGCAYNGEYQQVYNSGQFSGPVEITSLQFFNTQYDAGATASNSGTFDISLSTTSADWNTLSGTFASNIGADNTTVFNAFVASQPWALGDTLTFILSTPFFYNPANGNLLMDVSVSGASAPGGPIYFDVNSANTYLGRVYTGDGTSVDSGYGLVTGFNGGGSVPEPSFLLLVGAGLGLVALGKGRRDRAQG